jgi:D-alanine-D-alanine ligase
MNIALAFSSKRGLRREFLRRFPGKRDAAPDAFFAEGDTPRTISAVKEAIASNGHTVTGIEADTGLESKLRRVKPDLVYNIAEGLFGDSRESYVPAVCEKLSIPYTGSGPLTLGICLHKGRCKEILTANGIPNPPFRVFRPGEAVDLSGFPFPAIVKPVAEGSSKGVCDKSVADNAGQAAKLISDCLSEYGEAAIIEGFLPGAEFTVAMIGNGASLEVLPIVGFDFSQLPPTARKIYSYEAKWVWDTPKAPLKIFQCPAQIPETLRAQIERLVRDTARVLEIRDWCRMDVRLDAAGKPNIIEVNPIPGILPDPKDNSCFPKAARTAGYSYQQLFQKVIEAAVSRK